MGAFNMHLVMRSLEGVSLSIPWGVRKVATSKQKAGDTIMRDLDADDLALLLTIAYRQRDPEYKKEVKDGKEILVEKYPDVIPICYGSKRILMDISRVSDKKFDNSKRFLLKAELITYESEFYTRDVKHPEIDRMKTYNYVYRLNEEKLAACLTKATKGAKKSEKNDDATLSEGMGHPVRGHGGALSEGTKITKEKNKEKDNNKSGAVVENDKLVLMWQEFIAKSFGVNIRDVGTKSIREKVLDKDPKEVIAIICEVSANKNQHKKPIGFMFSKIENLQKVNLTPEQIEAQFSEARKLPAEKIPEADQSIETGWKRLVADLGLGELDEQKKKDIKEEFTAAMRKHVPAKIPSFVDNFIKRIARENGGDFEALKKANPDIQDRLAILRQYLEKEANQ